MAIYLSGKEETVKKIYEIYFKDIPVFSINRGNGSVEIYDMRFLPFDIYLEESTDMDVLINNRQVFDHWCAGRVLSLDRKYAKEICNYYGFTQSMLDADKADIAIKTRCLSLNDCFWLRERGEIVTWDDVNLFDNSLKNAVFEIALLGKSLTITNGELSIPDLSTKGTAPKAWRREERCFRLLKGDIEESVMREVEASQILEALGFHVVHYEAMKFRVESVSACEAFTSKDINFVAAQDYLLWCENNDISYQHLLGNAYNAMNIADYLTGNTDRHGENWGFLYTQKEDGFHVTQMAPLMDFDHAFLGNDLTICQPELLLYGKRHTQKETAEQTVTRSPEILDALQGISLSEFKYGKTVIEKLEQLKISAAATYS